jgi:hypothetical protein
MLGYLHVPPALQRLIPQEEVNRALALIFIVFPSGDTGLLRCSRTGREWLPDVRQQLHRTLVETDLGSLRLIGTGVDIKDILHVPAELRVLLRWDAPLLLEMGRQTVFLRTRRTNS